jgi:5'(3')-deoxyribonucleotidase
MRPIIGLDLDGVTADFSTEWRTRLGVGDAGLGQWDFLNVTPFKRWVEFWDWAREEHIFGDCPPYPGAVEGVKALSKLGTVWYLTLRPHWAKAETQEWLEAHDIVFPVVYDVAKWLARADLYIEDGPFVLEDLVTHSRGAKIIRVVRPWNEPVQECVDARDWTEIVVAAERLLKEK